MAKVFKTKLFQNGGSQAVRIPVEFRFDAEEVFVTFDALTQSVTISASKPNLKEAFFDLQAKLLPQISSDQLALLDDRSQPPFAPVQDFLSTTKREGLTLTAGHCCCIIAT